MFWRNLLITMRNLRRHPFIAAIGLFGLGLGLLGAILATLYTYNELTVGQQYAHFDRIYRVSSNVRTGGDLQSTATCGYALLPNMAADFPEIESYVRFTWTNVGLLRANGHSYGPRTVLAADSTLQNVFSLPLRYGTAQLNEPRGIVLTETAARALFGDVDPTGETVEAVPEGNFRVTGVLRDLPANDDLRYDALLSMRYIEQQRLATDGPDANSLSWLRNFYECHFYGFIRLRPGAKIESLASRFPAFAKAHIESPQAPGYSLSPIFLTLAQTHFSRLLGDYGQGDPQMIRVLLLIGILLLLTAALNYVNLATARGGERAREIALRKVIGASRRSLVAQFLTESVVLAILGLLLAAGLAELSLPWVNAFLFRSMRLTDLPVTVLVGSIGFAVTVGLLAGLYPALYLSRFAPARVLQREITHGKRGGYVRKALVVVQIVVSMGTLLCALVVLWQWHYLMHRDLGYPHDNVYMCRLHNEREMQAYPALRQEWLKLPGVLSVGTGQRTTGADFDRDTFGFDRQGQHETTTMPSLWVDSDYLNVLGVQWVQGGMPEATTSERVAGYVLNESAMRRLNWSDGAVGKTIARNDNAGFIAPVTGVVRDLFFFASSGRQEPAVFIVTPVTQSIVLMRLAPINQTATLAAMGEVWKRFNPQTEFLNVDLNLIIAVNYRGQRRMAESLGILAGLCLVLAMIGLGGLVACTMTQKAHEVCIRKILGGSVGRVVGMLVRQFVGLVWIATPVAWGLGGWAMNLWLQTQPDHVALPWWAFIASGLGVLLPVVALSGALSYRAATVSPASVLRRE